MQKSMPRVSIREWSILAVVLAGMALSAATIPARAALDGERLAGLVMPPYQLGQQLSEDGVWSMLTSGGAPAGYIFETRGLAPIPGFAGTPIDMLVTLDTQGQFLDVTLLEQNEPVFVSGLGQGPLQEFLRQYRGHSVGESIVVAAPGSAERLRGSASHVVLDGISRATASVRIANETIMAAALQVAREKMRGIGPRPSARPRLDVDEPLTWDAMVAQGIVRRMELTADDVQRAFAGSRWQDGDGAGGSDFLELWVADVGPPSIAKALLDAPTRDAVQRRVGAFEEPVLLLARGHHRLVDEDFVRNTTPERIAATQDGLPVALRDADIEIGLAPGVPPADQAMILRVDRRLGFDPASPWDLIIRVVRERGSFRPEPGVRDFTLQVATPARFFEATAPAPRQSAWLKAVTDRAADLALLAAFVGGLAALLLTRMRQLALHPRFPAIRLLFLAVTLGFVGWWGQGQLSIVTPLGMLRSALDANSLVFLLYDPFSLLLWAITLISLMLWGRGLFCGWLCPFGALQEFVHHLGRSLRLPVLRIRPLFDARLKMIKYAVLAILVVASLISTAAAHALVEVEPFKTAITLMFDRHWPYVLWAGLWLVLGLFVFKAFCRWVCPLGAGLALAGRVRRLDWIPRRPECGRPCQFCKAKCLYGAIEPDGRIDYAECFQCLDCVAIYADPERCVPERLLRRKGRRLAVTPERRT